MTIQYLNSKKDNENETKQNLNYFMNENKPKYKVNIITARGWENEDES